MWIGVGITSLPGHPAYWWAIGLFHLRSGTANFYAFLGGVATARGAQLNDGIVLAVVGTMQQNF